MIDNPICPFCGGVLTFHGAAERTDETVKSARRECHGRPVRVWRSLVWKSRGR